MRSDAGCAKNGFTLKNGFTNKKVGDAAHLNSPQIFRDASISGVKIKPKSYAVSAVLVAVVADAAVRVKCR